MLYKTTNAGKTAIHRKALSAPMRHLLNNNLIVGDTKLDYGCGRGFDADYLKMAKYDPNHGPHIVDVPTNGFDLITCIYVLNVIESKVERDKVVNHIKSLLSPNGIAYICVRRDIKKEGVTTLGTWQGIIHLDLPVIKETSAYCIYSLQK